MKKKTYFLLLALGVIYLITRLYKLVLLPVFADEAIYIRWTQLIMDDWQQYLFFPLNDGKTPLHMWLMLPFQYLFKDQLYAGRFLSVLVGLIQMLVMGKIVEVLNGKKTAKIVAYLSVILLPFFFFHHRMALIDALLTLMLSFSFYFAIKASKLKTKQALVNSVLAGLFLGLALWTKIPAVLFFPAIVLTSLLFMKKFNFSKLLKKLTYPSISILLSLAVFISLKLHPAFGQLFSRGNDFLYPLNEFFSQAIIIFSRNFANFAETFNLYIGWPVFAIITLALIKNKKSRFTNLVLILTSLSFLLPMLLLGKTVYARYLMASVIGITASFALSVENLWQQFKLRGKLLISVLLLITLLICGRFMFYSYTQVSKIPFSKLDQVQYLNEWSAGFGIKESVDYFNILKEDNKLLIATEGFFGTLPDGLLMYYHRRDVTNMFIQGIGQPVREIPVEILNKANDYDQVLLVVNSHRMLMDKNANIALLAEYCRPNNICQQIWDITEYSQKLANSSK